MARRSKFVDGPDALEHGIDRAITMVSIPLCLVSAAILFFVFLSGSSAPIFSGTYPDIVLGLLLFPAVEIFIAAAALLVLILVGSRIPLGGTQANLTLIPLAAAILLLCAYLVPLFGLEAALPILPLAFGSCAKFRRAITARGKSDPLGRLIGEFGFSLAFVMLFITFPMFLTSVSTLSFAIAIWYMASAIFMFRSLRKGVS